MSDKFTYRNLNTGEEVSYRVRSARLDNLPNWVLTAIPDNIGREQPDMPELDGSGRLPGMLGSSEVAGPRSERDPVFKEQGGGGPGGQDLPPSVPVGDPIGNETPARVKSAQESKSKDEDEKSKAPSPTSPPAKNANREEWVEYALSRGADAKQVESMKRDDLVAVFGS